MLRMRRRVSERYCAKVVAGAEDLMHRGQAGGDQGTDRALFFLILHARPWRRACPASAR